MTESCPHFLWRRVLIGIAITVAVLGLWLERAHLHAHEQINGLPLTVLLRSAESAIEDRVVDDLRQVVAFCVHFDGIMRRAQQVREQAARRAAVRRQTREAFAGLLASGRVLSFMRVSDRRIALTLDDGPSPATPRTLQILARHGVHATFFLIGSNAAHYPNYVRMIREGGHELENHTWSHELGPPYTHGWFTHSSLVHQLLELRRTDAGLHESTRFMRAPGGLFGPCSATIEAARELHKVIVNWDVSGDTPGRGRICKGRIVGVAPADLLAAYERRVEKGAIILMHPENPGSAPYTLRILERFVVDMQHKGYRFVTLDEMLLAPTRRIATAH